MSLQEAEKSCLSKKFISSAHEQMSGKMTKNHDLRMHLINYDDEWQWITCLRTHTV